MVIYSMMLIIESVFVAFRSAKFVLLKNSIFSVIKLGLPFVFYSLGIMGAFSIFSAYMTAAFICIWSCNFCFNLQIHYKPRFVILRQCYNKDRKILICFVFGWICWGILSSTLMP
jgi:hypothetical protein